MYICADVVFPPSVHPLKLSVSKLPLVTKSPGGGGGGGAEGMVRFSAFELPLVPFASVSVAVKVCAEPAASAAVV